MSPAHEKHLADILRETQRRMAAKYRHGQEHHGGALWRVGLSELVEEAIGEAIDQLVYLLSLKANLEAHEQQGGEQCNGRSATSAGDQFDTSKATK